MKRLFYYIAWIALLAAGSLVCGGGFSYGQSPAPSQVEHDVFGAVVNWDNYSSPKVTGTLGYAKLITGNTYSFTTVDVNSAHTHPWSVQTSITTGIAQRLTTVSKFQIYTGGTFGVATTGSNVGGAYSGRVLIVRPIKGNWAGIAIMGVSGATISNVRPVLGVGFGYQH